MKAVILAGGLGTRLKPFTEIIPKPLLPIGEKSILEIQIEQLKRFGFNEIFLATNYKSDYIENFFGNGEKHGVTLHISKEEKALGTVGPITILKEQLQEPFLLMNGDILTQLDFKSMYDFAIEKNEFLTIGIKDYVMPFAFGNVFYDGDYISGIEEKPNFTFKILAGIYIMDPKIFELIPENTFYGMDKLIHKMLKSKIPICKYDIKEYWLDIGQVSDYENAQKIYKEIF
jgi:NDP-mannose synthase